MPRSLEFDFQGSSFHCEITTVDRSKLYGSVSIETLDQNKQRCEVATLAIDGKTLVPGGGTAMGYVNNDGEWISRKDLVAVNLDGDPLPEVPSSFKQVNELNNAVSVDDFLNHSIRLVYLLNPESEIPELLSTELSGGKIFHLEFSYRGGVDTDPAFFLMDEKNALWLLVAEESKVQFVGLEQAAVCEFDEQDDSDDGEEDTDLDFGML